MPVPEGVESDMIWRSAFYSHLIVCLGTKLEAKAT